MQGQATEPKQRDQRAIFASCSRFLSGHGNTRMRRVLEDLAASTGAEERADRYGTGALIEEFEEEIADLLGKEAALFLPSGTMAQQIALRIWSERRGSKTVAFHPTCHLELREQKGYEYLHGLRGRLVGDAREPITLESLQSITEPVAALLLELPQRDIGGLLPDWTDLVAQTEWARERGMALHMDGARLWESGPYYDRSYAEIASLFDSVYVSFYKGVGAIAGAALAAPADIIAEARVWLRRHGGNLFQLFPFVLSARTELRRRLDRFPAYHRRAIQIAAVLREIEGIELKPYPPHTNMMHVYLEGDRSLLMDAVLDIAEEEGIAITGYLSPTELPNYSMFELTVGDAADELTDGEIEGALRRLVAASGETR